MFLFGQCAAAGVCGTDGAAGSILIMISTTSGGRSREHRVLGRDLHIEEAREVMAIVRRIAALLLLVSALDANHNHGE